MIQDLINKWVKVNKSHVVFAKENDKDRSIAGKTSITDKTTSTHGTSSYANNRSQPPSTIIEKKNLSVVYSGVPNGSVKNNGIFGPSKSRRFSGNPVKKGRRSLKRTNSQSDLLRLKQWQETAEQQNTTVAKKPAMKQPASSTSSTHSKTKKHVRYDMSDRNDILRSSAEISAAPINTGRFLNEQSYSQQLNSNMISSARARSIHSAENSVSSSHRRKHHRRKKTVSSVSSLSSSIRSQRSNSPPSPMSAAQGLSHQTKSPVRALHTLDQDHVSVSSSILQPLDDTTSTGSVTKLHENKGLSGSYATSFEHESSLETLRKCCEEKDKQIHRMQADIDYLRSVVIQNEISSFPGLPIPATASFYYDQSDTLSICSNSSAKSKGKSLSMRKTHLPSVASASQLSTLSNNSASAAPTTSYNTPSNPLAWNISSSGTSTGGTVSGLSVSAGKSNSKKTPMVAEASQRLANVTGRYQRQIEQMTRERSRWQNDMHLKLSKFARLCKELNEESSKWKDDFMSSQSELVETKNHCAELATEVELLRAKVSLQEKEIEESQEIRETLYAKDNQVLDRCDQELSQRDQVIEHLSTKLEKVMNVLELERRVQRQRRSIIFPAMKQQYTQNITVNNNKNNCHVNNDSHDEQQENQHTLHFLNEDAQQIDGLCKYVYSSQNPQNNIMNNHHSSTATTAIDYNDTII